MKTRRPTLETRSFGVLAVLAGLLVIARAVLVPVTHDEAMTFFVYVETGNFLPFQAHWDAGNHLLCTALAWLSYSAFGLKAWALRLPSVLAFLIYAAYAWHWGLRLRTPMIRWWLWAALLLMPFLLDFFSLFRGYGLALAFWTMALYELCALLEERTTKRLLLTLLAAAGATFSSLSLITLWAAVLAITAMVILRRPMQVRPLVSWIAGWLLLGAGPFLFAAAYVQALSEHGALYYGSANGILGATLPSLLQAMFGGSSLLAEGAVVLIVLAGTFVAWKAVREPGPGFPKWALIVAASLLWADVLGRVILFHWNGTLYPEDRTALQWVPLFLLLFAFALDRLSGSTPVWKWLALALLAFPLRTIATANLRTTTYWPEQAIPDAIFHAAATQQARSPHLLTIGAHHQMPACWGFGLRQRDLHLNAVDVTAFPHGGEDLLLIEPQRDSVPAGYHEVTMAPSGKLALYAHEQNISTTLLLDSTFTGERSDAEFKELWHPAIRSVQGRSFLVELNMVLRPDHEPMTGDLVVETNASDTTGHRNDVLFQFMRSPARSDSIHVVRRIPRVPMDAQRVVVYLWNPGGLWYSCSGRVRIHLVDNGPVPEASLKDDDIGDQ